MHNAQVSGSRVPTREALNSGGSVKSGGVPYAQAELLAAPHGDGAPA